MVTGILGQPKFNQLRSSKFRRFGKYSNCQSHESLIGKFVCESHCPSHPWDRYICNPHGWLIFFMEFSWIGKVASPMDSLGYLLSSFHPFYLEDWRIIPFSKWLNIPYMDCLGWFLLHLSRAFRSLSALTAKAFSGRHEDFHGEWRISMGI